ncbi:MAG: hypothetical protein WKF94_15185 [Solirubrobacteraceae bacterium]
MGAGLIALVAAAVAAGQPAAAPGAALPSRDVRWFNDEHRALTVIVPRGWHQGGAVAFSGDLVFSDRAVRRYRPGDRCPSGGVAPADDATLLYILEFGVWSGGPQARDVDGVFTRGRPLAREALQTPVVDDECFGRARRVRWRERGRAFQAHIFLGERTSTRRRRELAALFDGLRFRRHCGIGCPAPGDWAAPPKVVHDRTHGVSVTYPATWMLERNGRRGLFLVSSGPIGHCEMGPENVTLKLIQIHRSAPRSPRPAGVGPARRTVSYPCNGGQTRLAEHVVEFDDAGRSFRVRALVGREVSASRRAVLDLVLRHLEFRRDPGRFVRGRPTAYDALHSGRERSRCLGRAHFVQWCEAGRAFEARLRVGDGSWRELVSLFDSLRFRR